MKGLKMRVWWACMLLATAIACNDKKHDGKLSPDVINNPATASDKNNKEGLPEFKFKETRHHFGEIKEGAEVSYAFEFENVGEGELIIMDVATTCGCTSPYWPKEAIKPGQKGKIDVKFNSSGKSGMQSKTVTVFTNAVPSSRVLTISAEVISK